MSTRAQLAANRLGEPVGLYATAYFDAADVLFSRAASGRGLVDLCFYPAALSLRHGLELLAKQISDHVAYEMNDRAFLYVRGHELKAAWDRGSSTLRDIIENDYEHHERNDLLEHLDFLQSLVDRLDALDPSGMLFRYPEEVNATGPTGAKVRSGRADTHVPFDSVDLDQWAADSGAAVIASQSLRSYFDDRATALRHRRNHPPARLADLVMGTVPPEHMAAWRARSKP